MMSRNTKKVNNSTIEVMSRGERLLLACHEFFVEKRRRAAATAKSAKKTSDSKRVRL